MYELCASAFVSGKLYSHHAFIFRLKNMCTYIVTGKIYLNAFVFRLNYITVHMHYSSHKNYINMHLFSG